MFLKTISNTYEHFWSFCSDSGAGQRMQQDITKEHCDGNRNLLHTCVAMCAPTSNKDYDQGNKYKTFNNWNFNFMPMFFTLLYLWDSWIMLTNFY